MARTALDFSKNELIASILRSYQSYHKNDHGWLQWQYERNGITEDHLNAYEVAWEGMADAADEARRGEE